MKFYKNKLALVTGASEGIGKAICIELAKSGCHIIGISRSEQKLHDAFADIQNHTLEADQILRYIPCDVTDFTKVRETIEMIIADHGTPDILINCAGIARPGYIQDLKIEDYKVMMDLNYFGIVHTCKALAPHFIQKSSGWIMNTSSIAGFLGLFGYTGYSGSKFAVIGFSEALKRELKPYGIKVSVLCPPNTKTPGLEKENLIKPKEVLDTEEKAKTVSAEFVAKAALKDLSKGKFMSVPTFDGGLAFYLNRYIPSLIEQFVKRSQ